jgi:large subunit ribosomal protein L29
METHELLKKTDAELNALLRQMQADMRSMRFQLANSQLKNVRQARKTRKDIARIQTVLSQRANVIKKTATATV